MTIRTYLPAFGLGMLLLTALSLATIAAYQSIIGLADLFAARKEVVVIMAVFIEWAKLLFAGSLHMFWNSLPWWKWIGIAIVVIHMAVTNIGIYSYLSSGYLLQEAPVAALERRITGIDQDINQQKKIEEEASRQISAMDTAYQRYVEGLYIRRAEQYKATNAELRAQLEKQRDKARMVIDGLEEKKRGLTEIKVDNAAKLGSIEHISAFIGSDQESIMKMVVLFTILLMMGLDPAAVLLVVMFTHLLNKWMGVKNPKPVLEVAEKAKEEPKPLDKKAEEQAYQQHLKDIGYMEGSPGWYRRKKL